jgi:hypothetical protein
VAVVEFRHDILTLLVRLKMATKQKTSLLGVVSLGVLVIIAAIVRLIEVLKSNMYASLKAVPDF